jgi:hypothetical protein
MNKTIKDGRVAVLYSPGYGAGWSTWNPDHPEMIFDPGLVDLVLAGNEEKILAYVTLRWTGAVVRSGVDDLEIEWVPEGVEFVIEEYDGAETIVFKNEVKWITA